MITAIVLIDCATDSIPEVAEALADLQGVSEVYSVAGGVDLIAMVRVREFDQIAEVIAGRISTVVSSLPLVAHPLPDRIKLIEAGIARMGPGKPFIQFSYLMKGPIEGVPGRFTAHASRSIWMNLPPARVWLYRRAG